MPLALKLARVAIRGDTLVGFLALARLAFANRLAATLLLASAINSRGTTVFPFPRLSTPKHLPSSVCHQWACSSPQSRAFTSKPLLSVIVRHTPRLAGTEWELWAKASNETMSDNRKMMEWQ